MDIAARGRAAQRLRPMAARSRPPGCATQRSRRSKKSRLSRSLGVSATGRQASQRRLAPSAPPPCSAQISLVVVLCRSTRGDCVQDGRSSTLIRSRRRKPPISNLLSKGSTSRGPRAQKQEFDRSSHSLRSSDSPNRPLVLRDRSVSNSARVKSKMASFAYWRFHTD